MRYVLQPVQSCGFLDEPKKLTKILASEKSVRDALAEFRERHI